MSFGTPTAFILAALAVPIIVFYILKVRLRRVPVSTNLFWKQIYDEKPPRSIWQYLRHLLSLLVQLLMLTLLVFAVADPFFSWQLLQARRVVLVIDNSASMQAVDVVPTRLAAALDSARSLVEGLRFRDEMAIVLAGPRPEVVVGMSGHVPTLKRALDAITASDNPTELASAVALGKQLIGEHPHGQVIVFTDGCWDPPQQAEQVKNEKPQEVSESQAEATETPSVEYRLFGTDAANVGITQFQVRRSLIDPLGYEVLIGVRNHGAASVNCRIELELEGVPVDVLPLTLPPNEPWSRALEKTSLEGGHLSARLVQIQPAAVVAPNSESDRKPSDASESTLLNAIVSDDVAWAVLPPREMQRVLIVTPGNLFLQKVFEANPLVQVEVRNDFPKQWPTDAIVVLHRDVPTVLPSGNVFIVDPAGSCESWELGNVLENPIVTEQDKDSPLMTHVRLDNVLMPEAKQLKFKKPPHVLAGALSGEAVYAEVKRTEGKCLVLTVNLDRGDLAFRTAFPIMATNALGWFSGDSGELRESLATASITSVQINSQKLPDGAELVLKSPTGHQSPIARRNTAHGATMSTDPQAGSVSVVTPADSEESVSLGPFDRCGIWSVAQVNAADGSPSVADLAVNLASVRESDLRPHEEFRQREQTNSSLAGWFARPVWFYLLAAACILTVTEWFLYQRRLLT